MSESSSPEDPVSNPRAGVVPVRVDRGTSYEIRVEEGLLQRLPAEWARQHAGRRIAVLTDSTVHRLHARAFCEALAATGREAPCFVIAEGETSKSMATAQSIAEWLYQQRFDRRGLLVNLGGGLVCDVGGFVASMYLRGVEYCNVPTTLLAQHDAAIGGKVAVNVPWAKNFLGAFHHPCAVYADPRVLGTLPSRQLAAGISEAIKVATIADPVLFELLEREAERIQAHDGAVLREVVERAIRGKVELLRPDPYEHDLRRVLNFGHTFGHPLETELEYEGILHGEAVAWGMWVAAEVARARGMLERRVADRLWRLLARYDLPPQVPFDRLCAAVHHLEAVRLVRGNHLHFVLPTRIGAAEFREVETSEILAALHTIGTRVPAGRSLGATA